MLRCGDGEGGTRSSQRGRWAPVLVGPKGENRWLDFVLGEIGSPCYSLLLKVGFMDQENSFTQETIPYLFTESESILTQSPHGLYVLS